MKQFLISEFFVCAVAALNLTVSSHGYGQIKDPSSVLEEFNIRQREDLPDFVKRVKAISLLEDGEDDVLSKLGKPSSQNVLFGKKVWRYEFIGDGLDSVVCVVEYDVNDKAAHVYVTKAGPSGVQQIYSQGSSPLSIDTTSPVTQGKSSSACKVPVSAAAPDSPEEGQVYFNTADKSFYGWNGTAWVEFGAKP